MSNSGKRGGISSPVKGGLKKRQKIKLEALEPRYLFSADLLPVPAPAIEPQPVLVAEVPAVPAVDVTQFIDPAATTPPVADAAQQDSAEPDAVAVDQASAPVDTDQALAPAETAATQQATDPQVQAAATALAAGDVALAINQMAAFTQGKQLIIIDSAVQDYETLLSILPADVKVTQAADLFAQADYAAQLSTVQPQPASNTLVDTSVQGISQDSVTIPATDSPQNNYEVIVLDPTMDGIDQISRILDMYQGIAALQIISHGAAGSLRLGNTELDASNLDKYRQQLKNWGQALTVDGDILLYGCSVAEGAAGAEFVDRLSAATGADVAASINSTGSVELGGDWILEYNAGEVEATSLFAGKGINYGALLAFVSEDGTAAADTITVDFGAGAGLLPVVTGGASGTVDFAAGDTFFLDGLGGSDTLIIKDTLLNDAINVTGNQILFTGSDGTVTTINFTDFERVDILTDNSALDLFEDTITFAGDLTAAAGINAVADTITVNNSVILSSRFTAPAADQESANSIGNSGNIDFQAQNITIKSGAKLLTFAPNAPGSSHFIAGDISILASKTTFNPVYNNTIVSIDIQSTVAAPVVIKGNTVNISANVSSIMPIEALLNVLGSGAIPGATSALTTFLETMTALPVAVAVKAATATVTVGSGTAIDASGDVTVRAESKVDATAMAISTTLLSVGLSKADARAEATIADGVAINAAGNVLIESDVDSKAAMTALTSKNTTGTLGAADVVAIALSDMGAVSYATVSQGAVITSGKDVMISAKGKTGNSARSWGYVDTGGRAGVSLTWAESTTDIRATVAGTITAAGVVSAPLAIAATAINADNMTINSVAHGLVDGQSIEYIEGTALGLNLVDGKSYYVKVIDADNFQLKELPDLAIALDGSLATGAVNSLTKSDIFGFSPATSVDVASSTINFSAASGLQTGDRVTYNSMGETPIGGLVDGTDYYVVVVDDMAIQLAATEADATASTPVIITFATGATGLMQYFEKASVMVFDPATAIGLDNASITFATPHDLQNGDAVVYDAGTGESAVGGIQSGRTYYVVVEDANTIRLADSLLDALSTAEVVVLKGTAPVSGSFSLRLDAGSGITVRAELENSASAKASSALQVANGLTKLINIADTTRVAAATEFRSQFSGKTTAKTSSGTAAKSEGSDISVAGAVAYQSINNVVVADVAGTLKSDTGITVDASIVDIVQKAASASSGGKDTNKGLAASVSIGVYDNRAEALIGGTAVLDAKWDTVITSSIEYPYVTTRGPVGTLNTLLEQYTSASIPDELHLLLSLTPLGVNSLNLSQSQAGSVVVAGNVDYTEVSNVSRAKIADGAQINQDSAYRSLNQSITVGADLEVKNSSINGAITKGKQSKGSVGGSLAFLFMDNTTEAIVGAAALYSGLNGTTIRASERVQRIVITAAGGSAGKFGVSGSFALNNITSRTIAQIAAGAQIESAGDLTVDATSQLYLINLVGGVSMAANVGVGMSVSINEITRTTEALIGNIDPLTAPAGFIAPGAPAQPTAINVAGDIALNAASNGGVYSISLAAAVSSPPPETNTGTGTDSSASTSSAPASGSSGAQGKYGIGVSGDVSINTINDTTQAYINDSGTLTAANIALAATNGTTLVAASGAASFVSSANKSSAGLAGSYSQTTVGGTTGAWISGTTLNAGNLTLSATRTGDVITVSVGGAGAPGKTGIAIAGSVAINTMTDTTETKLVGVTANLTGNTSLSASKTGEIIAVGGGFGFGGKGGIGAAVGINDLSSTVRSTIDSSAITGAASVTLTANNNTAITAIAASGAASTQGVAGSGTVSINTLRNTTEASIKNGSSVTSSGAVAIGATDSARISSISGAVGAAKAAALGAAVAFNDLANTTTAFIDGSVVTAGTTATLLADSGSTKIETIAASGAGSQGFSLAASVSVNQIANTTSAYISNGSTMTAPTELSITARSNSTINALAGSVSASTKAAGGASVATNAITSTTSAYIDGATTTGTTGSVSIAAESTNTINSIAAGAAGAGNFAAGGSVTTNNIGGSVDAYISASSTIAASGSVMLSAKDNSVIRSLAGTLTGGGTASVGAAVSTNNITTAINAYIDASIVSAAAVSLAATSTRTIETLAGAGSGGGTAGVAGAVAVNNLGGSVGAYISGVSTITLSGALALTANDSSTIRSLAGGAAGGGSVGIAGAVVTNNITNSITSYVDASTVNAATVSLSATSARTIETISAAASGGGAGGLAGSVSVNNAGGSIAAYISGSAITATGSVTLTASDTSTIKSLAGAVSGGGTFGASSSTATNDITTSIAAYIDVSTINAATVSLSATSTRTIETLAAAGAGGGYVGIAGAVTTNKLGGSVSAYIFGSTITLSGALALTASDTSTIRSLAGGAAGGAITGVVGSVATNTITNSVAAYIDASTVNAATVSLSATSSKSVETISAAASGGGAGGLSGSVSVNNANGSVNAYISGVSNITTTGKIDVMASETSNIQVVTGAASGGFVGIGASVSTANINNVVNAYIGAGTTLSAGGDINISATGTISGTGVQAYVGGGIGAAAATAAVATFNSANSVAAYIGDNSTVLKADNLSVLATSSSTINATGFGVTVGGVAVGGVVAVAKESGTTKAYLGNNVTVGERLAATAADRGVNNLTIGAQATVDVNASATAAAAGIASGSGSDARSTATPTVKAYIGTGASIGLTGSQNQYAIALGEARADASGINIGGITVGVSLAASTWNANVDAYIGANSMIVAGGDVMVNAFNNFYQNGVRAAGYLTQATSSSATGALIGGSGSSSTVNSSATVNASVNAGASVTSGGNINVLSKSSQRSDAYANGDAYGVVSGGGTFAYNNLTDNTTAFTGAGAILNATGNVTVSGASKLEVVRTRAVGAGGGLLTVMTTDAIATITANMTTTIGANSIITAGGILNVEALSDIYGRASGTITTGAAVTTNLTSAEITTNVTTLLNIGSGVVLSGSTVNLNAKVLRLDLQADAFSKTVAASSVSTADSTLNTTVKTDLLINTTGVKITGSNAVNMLASNAGVKIVSLATARILAGITGSVFANAHNNAVLYANVNVQTGTIISSDKVLIEAFSPKQSTTTYQNTPDASAATVVNYVMEAVWTAVKVVEKITSWIPLIGDVIKWVTKTVWKWVDTLVRKVLNSVVDAKATGTYASSNRVTFNGEILQGSSSPQTLTVNADGTLAQTGTGIVATTTASDVTVDAVNTSVQSVTINSAGGAVAGTGLIRKNSVFSTINITNNSSKNLIINNISPRNYSPVDPALIIDADSAQNTLTMNFVTDAPSPVITIQNNTASNILFTGKVSGAEGSMSVTNTLGSILGEAGSLIQATDLTMTANLGSVGTVANKLAIDFYYQNNINPKLTMTAGQDVVMDMGLKERLSATPAAGYTINALDVNSISAGGDIVINGLQAEALVPSAVSPTPLNVAGNYNLNNITSTNGSVNVSITSGNAIVGVINATRGAATLSASGSILDMQTDDAAPVSDINANNIVLTSLGSGIGSASNYLEVDSASTAAGTVSAAANGDIFINELVGTMTFNNITSTLGNVNLASAGSMLDVAASTVAGGVLNLTSRAGSIGTAANLLDIDSNLLTATGATGVNLNERAGDLNVNMVVASAGNATLRAAGSVLDANNTAAANVVANSVTLTGVAGSIGTAANAFDIDSMLLTATAGTGVRLIETAGSLNVNGATTVAGDIVLTTPDAAAAGQDVMFGAASIVNAQAGSVIVNAGDNIAIASGAQLNAAGTINLNADVGNADAGVGSSVAVGGALTATSIAILTGVDNDVVSLSSVQPNSPVSIDTAAGNDTINIGSKATPTTNTGGVASIVASTVTVNGGAGIDALWLDNTGDPLDRSGILTATTIAGLGMAAPVNYANIENLDLVLGAGVDNFTIQDTSAVTNLNTGAGADVVNVQGTGAVTNVNTGAGADVINVSSNAPINTGNLDQITGTLNVDGGAGTNALNIMDPGATVADPNIIISATAVTGIAPADINYTATGGNFLGGVTIFAGMGGNNIQVIGVLPNVLVRVGMGAGDDVLIVSSSVTTGELEILGQAGNDIIDASAAQIPVTLIGGAGFDTLTGSAQSDFLVGDDGQVIRNPATGEVIGIVDPTPTLGGADIIIGGLGDDWIAGGFGNDVLFGDFGIVTSQTAADMVANGIQSAIATNAGKGGADTINGGLGNDLMFGGFGGDLLNGNAGNDVIFGDAGQVLFSGAQTRMETISYLIGANDNITPGAGNDFVFGGAGFSDTITFTLRDDVVFRDQGIVVLESGLVSWIMGVWPQDVTSVQIMARLMDANNFSVFNSSAAATAAVPVLPASNMGALLSVDSVGVDYYRSSTGSLASGYATVAGHYSGKASGVSSGGINSFLNTLPASAAGEEGENVEVRDVEHKEAGVVDGVEQLEQSGTHHQQVEGGESRGDKPGEMDENDQSEDIRDEKGIDELGMIDASLIALAGWQVLSSSKQDVSRKKKSRVLFDTQDDDELDEWKIVDVDGRKKIH